MLVHNLAVVILTVAKATISFTVCYWNIQNTVLQTRPQFKKMFFM